MLNSIIAENSLNYSEYGIIKFRKYCLKVINLLKGLQKTD
jgi:hypothetical protein